MRFFNLPFYDRPPDWLRPEWAREIGLLDRWRAAPTPPPLGGLAQQQRYYASTFPRRHVNFDALLAYVGSQGMELRHPFHDQRLVKFFMGCDGGLLRRGAQKKYLLRQAMLGTLPEVTRARQTKADISAYMWRLAHQHLTQRAIEALAPVRLGWLDAARLRAVDEAVGRWLADGSRGRAPANYAIVWNAVAIDLWLEHAFRL
jgi:asparagine synthase (glutamine-hydrolysing)